MKPTLPKGTRDFSSKVVLRRNYIFDTVKSVFEKYGFNPIETPAMESLSTLMGKYGEEGDQLLFKVLNNGDFLRKVNDQDLSEKNSKKVTTQLSKRGLRYDLTVPFARFVVMNRNDLAFPFKRYQIQPVWRADRPQKGRFQEFFQCDVDVVGSNSLMYEAELVQIYDEVFAKLGLDVTIRINNRKLLAGMAEVAGIADKLAEMTIALDKIDKIGMEGVEKEMEKSNISLKSFEIIKEVLNTSKLDELNILFSDSEIGKKGIEEMKVFYSFFNIDEAVNEIKFDLTLARGLSYYTGCIFEVEAKGVSVGSIGGGGRYDNLTGTFGLKDVSGVGVSFGADRIYMALEEKNLFPEDTGDSINLFFVSFDEESHNYAFQQVTKLRKAGIKVDIYPTPAKMNKQMKYANNRNAKFVVVIGSDEVETGLLTVKNMNEGSQEKMKIEKLAEIFGGEATN